MALANAGSSAVNGIHSRSSFTTAYSGKRRKHQGLACAGSNGFSSFRPVGSRNRSDFSLSCPKMLRTKARTRCRPAANSKRPSLACRPSMATSMFSFWTVTEQAAEVSRIVAMPQAQLTWLLASISPGWTSRAAGRQKFRPSHLTTLAPRNALGAVGCRVSSATSRGFKSCHGPACGVKQHVRRGELQRLRQPRIVQLGGLHLNADFGRVANPGRRVGDFPAVVAWQS